MVRAMRIVTLGLVLLVSCAPVPVRPGPPAPAKAPVGAAPAPVAIPDPPPAAVDDHLGSLTFEVTGGTDAARRDFRDGLLAMHSFWYTEATRLFEAAIAADPTFVMARWGLAMSYSQILFQQDDLERGRAALALITDVSALTDRERAWIDAARALFAADNPVAGRSAFVAAMETIYRDHPDDEASVFLALGLISSGPPGQEPPVALRARAGSLALEVLARNPRHPGAAHYIIHAFDTQDLAALALPAARTYAKIAPAAYHARHMPAHIFGRFGLWEEALASCQAAWDTSVEWTTAAGLPADRRDFHSLTWIVALYLELGRLDDAEATVQVFAEQVRSGLDGWRGGYIESVQLLLAGTEAWDRVDELLAPLEAARSVDPEMPTGENAPPMERFERMQVAQLRLQIAAEQRDVAAVKRLQKQIHGIMAELKPWHEKMMGKAEVARLDKENAPLVKLGDQLSIARAKRDHKASLPLIRKLIAHLEAKQETEPAVTGGSPREGLAETLMAVGKHEEALAEYEAVLVEHPNRARVLLAAARAATKAGNAARAHAHYTSLLGVWHGADADFPGLDEATKAAAAPAPAAEATAPVTTPPPGHHH